MTYFLKTSQNYPSRMIGEYDRQHGPDRFLLYDSKKLSEEDFWTPEVRFVAPLERIRKFDNLSSQLSAPLVNRRLRYFLEAAAPEQIQFIPVKIVGRDGETINEYWVINPLHTAKTIDHERTVCEMIAGAPDVIGRFKSVYLLQNAMGDLHIAREEERKTVIVISDHLAEKMIFNKFVGIEPVKAVGQRY